MPPKNNLQGTKYLIAAGAMAGTVGGWIILSLANPAQSGAVMGDPALQDLLNQPLPTLVQAGPAQGGSSAGGIQPANSIVQPAGPQPLRSVSKPPPVYVAPRNSAPAPVVTTRSSKK
jgi:hypothetical protein